MNKQLNKFLLAALTAAIYVVLCLIFAPISFGPIQFRISEVLCLLSIDYLWAYLGVTIGCFLSNTLWGGLGMIDMIFGTLATVIGCGLAYLFRKKLTNGYPVLSALMIVIANGIIVGAELGYVFNTPDQIPLFIGQVAIGEFVVLMIGLPVYKKLKTIIDDRLA